MIFRLASWPLTLNVQIEVKLRKKAHNPFLLHFQSLIFGLKWLLGLLGHYSWSQKFVLDFSQKMLSYFILHSWIFQDYKYVYILEAIYLRHIVTIYDRYNSYINFNLASWPLTLSDLEKSNLKKAHNLFCICLYQSN